MGGMTLLRELALPVPASQTWLEGLAAGVVHEDGQVVLERPDHTATIALRLDSESDDALVVMGPRTAAIYHAGQPGRAWLKVRLRAAALPGLFGTAVSDLVDRAVPLSAIWGDRAVRHLVGGGASSLLTGIAARIPDDRDTVLQPASALLAAGVRVDETARRLGVSERRLRAVFAASVGISPKQYARISRLRSLLGQVEGRPLAQLAVESGYYDQAHLSTEFKALMGVPPAAFRKGRMPAATPCQSPK
jgi:AraC-like DNA-binding protein